MESNLKERRRFPRVDAKVPVRFQMRDSGKNGLSISYNISSGGIQALSFDFLPKDKNLIMELFLSDAAVKIVNMVARVVWSEQLPYVDRYRVGLEFNYISEEAKKSLTDFINSRIQN